MLLSLIHREYFFLLLLGGEGGGGVLLGGGDKGLIGNRIQTWALEEARRRLEVEGILKEPESKE